MYIGREMYAAQTDPVLQRDLFKKSVKRIEVETHSYCNRRCDYCPNVIGDRLGPNVHIQQTIYDRLLSGLAEVDFEHAFVLNSYNEPLYDRAILDRIAEARRALPKARLMIYTNGDYLTPEYVSDLADAGLNYLHVSIHTQRGDVYDDRYVLNRISEIAHRTRLQVKYSSVNPGSIIVAKFATPRLERKPEPSILPNTAMIAAGCCPTCRRKKSAPIPALLCFRTCIWGLTAMSFPAAISAATVPSMLRMSSATLAGLPQFSTSSFPKKPPLGVAVWCTMVQIRPLRHLHGWQRDERSEMARQNAERLSTLCCPSAGRQRPRLSRQPLHSQVRAASTNRTNTGDCYGRR
ncbi:MAG: hypothetical protein JWS11_1908 [Cypionkella sp.]|nr:radical SAM protein [Cypionkella sp.]MDB5665365.1 hypothetical protein [Cypionkella sp.]